LENFKEHGFREVWREFIFKFREPGREYINTMVCVDISIHRHAKVMFLTGILRKNSGIPKLAIRKAPIKPDSLLHL
jgi:hypothetical protein